MQKALPDFRSNQYLFFLVTFSIVSVFTVSYSILFSRCGIASVSQAASVLSFFYFSYVIAAFITKRITILYRLGIITLQITFFIYSFHTGGIQSSYVYGFIIPSLIPFFYRPYLDRYIFIGISMLCIIAQLYLTEIGIAKNLLAIEDRSLHSFLVVLLVFSCVYTYILLFRQVIIQKNKTLKQSFVEKQEATQKLIQSEKMASLGILSAGVAHEINNPLNFIKNGAFALSAQIEKTPENQSFISIINEGVDRLSNIVSSMNHFSRSTDSMDEEFDLNEVVENCLVILQHKLKYKVEVKKDLSEKPLRLKGNEGKLHQAILNILSNAEQAILEKGSITIQTSSREAIIHLKISDSGIGIRKENLSKISDPFFTTKSVGQGTGLGLSITYKIIKEHKGEIEVSSERNKGTTFSISFSKDPSKPNLNGLASV